MSEEESSTQFYFWLVRKGSSVYISKDIDINKKKLLLFSLKFYDFPNKKVNPFDGSQEISFSDRPLSHNLMQDTNTTILVTFFNLSWNFKYN